MDLIRSAFDLFYDAIKPVTFRLTRDNPKKAHKLFVRFCSLLDTTHLERIVLDNLSNQLTPDFELSNAAGFNKDGKISPEVLFYLGFDRAVIGTVTRDAWKGNTRPTIRRYSETESLVNWEGLPGEGAMAVAQRLAAYGNHGVPITINFMSTPKKQGDELLRDLEGTILATKDLPYVDRFELNISCPNTHSKSGSMDTREENLRMLDSMLSVMEKNTSLRQQHYLKVSPDSTQADVDDTVDVASHHMVDGVVTSNTSTVHDREYIPISPIVNGKRVGGASGNAVYQASLKTQILYAEKIRKLGLQWKLIAVGGINSAERVSERLRHGATEIQIYTPLVFSGPRLIRQLRAYKRF